MSTRAAPATTIEIPLASHPFELVLDDLTQAAWRRLAVAREECVAAVAGRTIWSVNSTASGGGVAEIHRTLLPYWRGSGLQVRWLVLSAPPHFFRLTKRIHNMLHGEASDRPLGLRARRLYEEVLDRCAAAILAQISSGDVVLLHDPQTAGLAPALTRQGAVVIWRCHVGSEASTPPTGEAWKFLLPYVRAAQRCVFTRREFVPPELDPSRIRVIAPAIDPRSPKNQALDPERADAILHHCGLAAQRSPATLSGPAARTVSLAWGGARFVHRRCSIRRAGPRARIGEDPLILALARWDRLKDPLGIMHAFANHVKDHGARLLVAGPPTATVTDDPEGAAILRMVRAEWSALPAHAQRRIDLAVLPMVDPEENALIVNALQRRASVIVKKSLQEGFGLGVAEAMWKTRPVVASDVGGHRLQIDHGRTGLLVHDPADLASFGAAVTTLLDDPSHALDLAAAGHVHARNNSLADRHFIEWSSVLSGALTGASSSTRRPRAPGSPASPRPDPRSQGYPGVLAAEEFDAPRGNTADARERVWSQFARVALQRAAAARRRAAASDRRADNALAAGLDPAPERAAARAHRAAAVAHVQSARHYQALARKGRQTAA